MLGFAALVRWRPPAEIGPVSSVVSPGALLFLLVLVPLDSLLGGLRYRMFFNGRIFPRVPLWHCIRGNWANVFLGAVTPSQTGGGPAQLYVLCRHGASFSQSVLVSLLNFIATLTFFALGGVTALVLIPPDTLSDGATRALAAAVTVVAAVAGLLVVAILVRSGFVKLPGRVAGWLARGADRGGRVGAFVRRILTNGLRDLRHDLRAIARSGWPTLARVVVVTPLLFLNKYVIGFVLAWALQGAVDRVFIGLQLLQSVLLYFAPTPGASGLAEASSGVLLSRVLAPEIMVRWVIGWRFLTTFLASVLGLFVLLGETRRHLNGAGSVRGGGAAT